MGAQGNIAFGSVPLPYIIKEPANQDIFWMYYLGTAVLKCIYVKASETQITGNYTPDNIYFFFHTLTFRRRQCRNEMEVPYPYKALDLFFLFHLFLELKDGCYSVGCGLYFLGRQKVEGE